MNKYKQFKYRLILLFKMLTKIVQIIIPEDKIVPDIISTFSLEENYLMLKIGSETLMEGRKVVTNLTNNEVYKKIENDFKKEIESLDNEIELEKQVSLKMQEKISKMYETQIEQLNKKLENAMNQIIKYEKDMSVYLEEEVNKVKEKYDLLLEEKDKQNQLNREVFDKATNLINKTINKSSISIGDDGEQIFEKLADTFRDFVEYRIENKAKQGHKGDFHLFFKDFNVLVDSKNYTGSVQKKEIVKIESDLNSNINMNFAWLVSLNSNICEYNKFPIMTKWITTDVGVKCILMINNLLSNKEPRDILRQAWHMCEDFYKLTKNVEKEDGELEKYIKRDLLYKKHINNLQDRASEIRRGLNISYNILTNLDNDLLEMLSLASNEIVNINFELNNKINEWWNDNIEYVKDESKMTSTELWSKFKKDNKDYVGVNKITIEDFKNIVTGYVVNSSTYIERTKKSVIEFIGFKWKQLEVKPIENLVVENIIIEKPKKIKKEKTVEFYFDEEKDKKILEEYENEENDIMTISKYDNIRPWQIVSLLIRYKVIKKRDEARGYDKYKETEEYKNKVNSKTDM